MALATLQFSHFSFITLNGREDWPHKMRCVLTLQSIIPVLICINASIHSQYVIFSDFSIQIFRKYCCFKSLNNNEKYYSFEYQY